MPNFTCPVEYTAHDPEPLRSADGTLNFKLHYVGWIVSGLFALVATVLSFWLIWQHLSYYTHPLQQRNIIRLLFMVPVYALGSWMSYLWYRQAIYFQTVRDCYEAIVIVSFFHLLLQYVGDTSAQQQAVFRTVKLERWFWPLGRWKYRPKTGLDFLWIMKVCILQYAVCLPVCTITTLILESLGLYCENSWMPWFGHVWISIVWNVSVTVAMYCLIVFYLSIADQVKPYKALLKLFALKAVVFLCFWQGELIAILVATGAIKPSMYTTPDELQAEILGLVVTIEMACFALLHLKAFPYGDYRPVDGEKTARWRGILDAADYRDLITDMKESSRFVYRKARGRTTTHVDDIRAERLRHLQMAMGRVRVDALGEKGRPDTSAGLEDTEGCLDSWRSRGSIEYTEDDALAGLHRLEMVADSDKGGDATDGEVTTCGCHDAMGGRQRQIHDKLEEWHLAEESPNHSRGWNWWLSRPAMSLSSQVFGGYSLPPQQHEGGLLEYAQPDQYQPAEPSSNGALLGMDGPQLSQRTHRSTEVPLQSPLDKVIAFTRHSSMPAQAWPKLSGAPLKTREDGATARVEHQGPLDLQRSREASHSSVSKPDLCSTDLMAGRKSEAHGSLAVAFEPCRHLSEPASSSGGISKRGTTLTPLDEEGEALRVIDMRGKRIQLVMPAPLSPARYPLSSRRQVEAREAPTPANQGQTATPGSGFGLRGRTMYDPWSGEPIREE